MKVDRKLLRTRLDFIEEAEALLATLRTAALPPEVEHHRDMMIRHVERMVDLVRRGELPPRPRKVGLAWHVIDEWPWGHPVGSEIIRIEAVYDHLT